jgi:hypothetical protein
VLRRRGLTGGQDEGPAGKVVRRREPAAFGR